MPIFIVFTRYKDQNFYHVTILCVIFKKFSGFLEKIIAVWVTACNVFSLTLLSYNKNFNLESK